MTIKEMQDNIIQKWGFEADPTLFFFNACETCDNHQLLIEVCYEFAINWLNLED